MTWKIMAATVAVIVSCSPAWAQQIGQAPSPSHFDLFAVIDANADGKITAEESEKNAAAYFDRVDHNQDGILTLDELKIRAADVEAMGAVKDSTVSPPLSVSDEAKSSGKPEIDAPATTDKLAQRIEERSIRQFSAIDTNGDGQATRQEYLARAVDRFHQADTDANGTLSREEFQARRQALSARHRQEFEQKSAGNPDAVRMMPLPVAPSSPAP